ncbi:MAG TPA: hypothetical protein VHB54_16565 [Mucilaginibacter sp.]|nr:hypothetical protein [Mucilaginibacter sp.]
MNAIHPQYITDEQGKKISVVIPVDEFEQLLEELEELDDIKLFDEAEKESGTSMPFDEYVKQRRAK